MELLPNERGYKKIAHDILHNGSYRKTRNGHVRSLPNQILKITGLDHGVFPIITTRYIHWPGILGEYAALIRGPKNVEDFERWGCNYWSYLGDENGNLNLDYGNLWIDADGRNQMQEVANDLRNNPTSRRMVISGWRPDKLDDLNLPCCHHNYQFYSDGNTLDLLWIQRSGDWMVGVPSDVVLSATMLLCFSSVAALRPGTVKFIVGDAHVYADHINDAHKQIKRLPWAPPKYDLKKQNKRQNVSV